MMTNETNEFDTDTDNLLSQEELVPKENGSSVVQQPQPQPQPQAIIAEAKEDKENDAERNKDIVEEFEYLLEKSQQLFSGLSELPEIGSKFWMPHFQRTFEIYTKLWKFQNQHRVLLENPDHYGLKRWEVGEIASKIGQLYYRYYLRTSETNYLQEAFIFYDAIRDRNYFKGEEEVKNSALMIKKLRYYARFIVVCLQMNNAPMMLQLLEEVKALIDVFATTFNPVDKMEWSLVVKEMALFMQAVCSPVPNDEDGTGSLPISYRLVSRRRPKLEKENARFRLQEAVIVGNRPTQIKFSELTLDMYYMLQMLEREPNNTNNNSQVAEPITFEGSESFQSAIAEAAPIDTTDKPGSPLGEDSTTAADKEKTTIGGNSSKRTNPHKYVLYQPTFSQIQVYLANAFKEIGDQGCVLLYLSSDGSRLDTRGSAAVSEAAKHGFIGGISATARRSNQGGETNKEHNTAEQHLTNSVHPADLLPYTRKPFFLIAESNQSLAYKHIPNLFNQPLLCLLSPTEYPISSQSGSIYTFFLHSPLIAFCVISQITGMAADKWQELTNMFGKVEDLAFELLSTHIQGTTVRRFLNDDFLRQLMVRHAICCVVLEQHKEFNKAENMPQTSPDVFGEVVKATELVSKIKEIVEFCAVQEFYQTGTEEEEEQEKGEEKDEEVVDELVT